MKTLDNEEIYHLADVISMRIIELENNNPIFDLMKKSQKVEAIKYDRLILKKLKKMLTDEADKK